VSQSEGGVVQRFVYDSMGRIIGEYATSPSAIRGEYIYLHPDAANDNASPHGGDDGVGGYGLLTIMTPDAAAGGAITAQYPHSNHLGAPLFSTDASGAVVTPGTHTQPVFPGQLRTRADLYYNRHRDYDPTTGQYIQADPIGLAGGSNLYLYANANPMRYVDPTGENPLAVAAALCVANPVACVLGAGALWIATHPPYIPGARKYCLTPPAFDGGGIGGDAPQATDIPEDRVHPSKCAPIYEAIDRMVNWINEKERDQDFGSPDLVAGHHKAILQYTTTLRGLVKTAENQGCYNYNPEARRILKMY
jgi:RHS repeat-associated protein